MSALKVMLDYAHLQGAGQQLHHPVERAGENQLQTSYFRAKNVLEALDKLFYDRDPNSITVFSVMLNPIT